MLQRVVRIGGDLRFHADAPMKRTMPEPSWIETACTEPAEADHLRLLEELVRCTNGAGYTENHDAEGWLVSPEGKRIVR